MIRTANMLPAAAPVTHEIARHLAECACGCGGTVRLSERTRRWRESHGYPLDLLPHHGKRADGCYRWKGGRKVTRAGYVEVLTHGHPHAGADGYALEHLILASAALGRPVPTKHPVHHINAVKSDNRPANLVICESAAFHALLEVRGRAFRACGRADWLKCRICKEWDAPESLHVYPNGKAAYHPACNRAYDAQRSRS